MNKEDFLEGLLEKIVDNKNIFSAVLSVEKGDGSFTWTGAAGSMKKGSKYFIASVTKFYVTAVVLQLINEQKIELNDKISKYLPKYIYEKLHIFKGIDYSEVLTIKHLISNTSGLPDYFFHKNDRGKTVADELMSGKDEEWSVDKTINLIKELKPNFKPGSKKRAAYSDTNYQLLGMIIEKVTQKNINEVFYDYIFSKLNLKNTYGYQDINDVSPVAFYYNKQKLWLPKYISSVTVEGGIVSTASEVSLFLKAFFNNKFFPKEDIEILKKWNLILPPPGLFYFGIGLERMPTPWMISPFKPIKEILGFWGQTGSFAFYNPETDLYFTGTTNQINGKGHMAIGEAIIKIIKKLDKYN